MNSYIPVLASQVKLGPPEWLKSIYNLWLAFLPLFPSKCAPDKHHRRKPIQCNRSLAVKAIPLLSFRVGPCNAAQWKRGANINTPDLHKETEHLWLNTFLKILFIYFWRGEREGEREGEKHQCVLASYMLPTGYLAATQACALTGNRTGDLLVPRPVLNPLSYTSQGWLNTYISPEPFHR